MENRELELLRKLGEETIYSAKGHFKACDIRRKLITYTIWLCAAINVIGVMGIHHTIDRWFAAAGLFGTIALLIWNEGEGKSYRMKHKEVAEAYLSLHKEIRSCYFLTDCDQKSVEELGKKVSKLDQTDKPEIPGFARKRAKRAIEKKDSETDNWFLND